MVVVDVVLPACGDINQAIFPVEFHSRYAFSRGDIHVVSLVSFDENFRLSAEGFGF